MATTGRGMSRLGCALLLVVGLGAAGCGSQSRQTALRLSACTVQGVPAQCGSLSVAENRLTGEGRRISLRVVVVPATTPGKPDPVVFLAGGPGDAATDHVADMVQLRALRDRDQVFVDQRGTGGSHRLICPSPVPEESDALAAYVASCLRRLDGDPRFYTTGMAADDLAEVLTALRYTRVNLYGGSYGATMAQVFQRRHPGMVRTMTLLSGTLLDVPIFERLPLTSQAALDDVFARCRSDAACSAAFPHLDADWERLMADLRAAPVTVPPERTPDGQPFVLTADLLAAAMHELLLSADSAARIPWAVHTLATAPDRVAAVLAVTARVGNLLGGDGTLLVMKYATRCNEAWARFGPDAVSANGQGSYYLGAALGNARDWNRTCALFPAAGRAADEGPAAASDVPVLMFNGSADPQDPPSNMAGAAALWPHSLQLVEPHQSHSTSQWRCQESIVDAFLESGSTDGLSTYCIDTVPPPRFETS